MWKLDAPSSPREHRAAESFQKKIWDDGGGEDGDGNIGTGMGI